MESPIKLAVFREWFKYNYWARDEQMAVLAGLSPEQITKPMGSSFTSLHATLVHMVAVERIWLDRWLGKNPKTLQGPEEMPGLEGVRAEWHKVENDMNAFLDQLDEKKLAEPFTYTNMQGIVHSYDFWRVILHVLNHQSYHRGQISTLLRQHGVTPVGVDYLIGVDRDFQ